MNHLLRDLAPFGVDAWTMLDDEARSRLTGSLSARRIVDFDGPLGWKHSAVDLGRTDPLTSAPSSIQARRRKLLPLSELRAGFRLSRNELLDFSRGATDIDLGPLDEAALALAAFENEIIFHGWSDAGITGIVEASSHADVAHDGEAASYRDSVAEGVAALRRAGVDGPYTLAAGPDDWVALVDTDDAGYPLRKQLHGILGGPIEWTPGLRNSVIVSARGGDYQLTVGEDLALGYASHDATTVDLYVEETLAFRVNTPEAAVRVVPQL
ncbi:family 1 encapsulin nanocompartment shell protein [Frondihabitans australicus]|uniref:Type 1 encapsulin shell protein n=1 Tax=Frondihabitans australicus TaxID=386892 RepID=A0A495IM43_9MICO|nr:family 1 encapsulin nanocompartment shell protein [Frondihabitans australicus]RKR76331.1 putative linocin/CFP29 family protein [Frondihabitans australicus]